jgi:hypothetical protein
MHRPPSTRISGARVEQARVVAVGLVAALGSVVIGLWWLLDIRSPIDVLAYQAMIFDHYHPIWKDLASRHIRKGDPVEDVVKRHPPLRREDFPPYTALRYHEVGSSDKLVIGAKDGKLIFAAADSHSWTLWTEWRFLRVAGNVQTRLSAREMPATSTKNRQSPWPHFFFESPEHEESFNKAYSAYAQQRILESQAFQIHQVIKSGQDVFLGRVIDSPGQEDSTVRELEAIYGHEYLAAMGLAGWELTVEVTTVLHGDLQVGTVLTFPARAYCLAKAGEPEPVFLHVDHMRLLYPLKKAREGYVTVPRKALEWYQSLTPEQVSDLEARSLARQSQNWQPEELPTRQSPKTEPQPATRGFGRI